MKVVKFLFTPLFMGVLFILFALSMAFATFIENDFGSAAAYSLVYNSFWFELILFLLVVNLTGQIFEYKLYRKAKLTVLFFHLAFVIMILGAGITRYFGYEGSIHIREGQQENRCFSSTKYIGYNIKDEKGNLLGEHSKKYSLTEKTADNYKSSVSVNGEEYKIVLSQILPNANEVVTDSPGGTPIVSFMISSGGMEMEKVVVRKGESVKFGNYSIGFASSDTTDFVVGLNSDSFFITSRFALTESDMMSKSNVTFETGERVTLRKMQVLNCNNIKIIPQDLSLSASIEAVGVNPQEGQTGMNAFIFNIQAGGKQTALTVWDNPEKNISTGSVIINGKKIEIFYGSKIITLPFSIRLNKFIFERYPGSNSPSGYKSDVLLIDETAHIEKPFMIFMNNILKYKGYRFYQSSFDKDEKGTVLSINHDNAGMLVSYTGYCLLFLFIVLSLVNKNSVFHNVNAGYWKSPLRKIVSVLVLMLLVSGFSPVNAQKLIPDKKSAEEFGKVLVQDQKGRTKPLFTMSNDILRKVTRENEFEGMSSMQVFLGLYLDFADWKKVPLIRVSNKDIQNKIGVNGSLASFDDLVDLAKGGTYKLADDVQKAYSKAPAERNKFDKELMKVDERANIIYMIYTGEFMKIFPLKNSTHTWGTSDEALKGALGKEDSLYLSKIIPMFSEALANNNLSSARQIAVSVGDYQKKFAGYELPSESKTKAELLYYKSKVFERLFPFYATIGLVMLISLIVMVIRGRKENSKLINVLGLLMFAGFIMHTLGLGLRWYIAGHSPMSNGYESMIFISFVTILAGFIFRKKSAFALPATAILGSMTLMVAHLSFMDPEITNLVPVLKSYWLTLHVSVITGSYGFLGFGAIISLITMVLLSLSNHKNIERIGSTIDELTVLNYQTLTVGLYMLTIGTFLGAVWANESWGRYWGWDPKETWSLITVIIYSLVIHSRMIPSLKDVFSFNILSLFAFSCVLMTYFGVNYYLSGMHSYASGDPIPVPSFVYIAVILLAALSLLAYIKYTNWRKVSEKEK